MDKAPAAILTAIFTLVFTINLLSWLGWAPSWKHEFENVCAYNGGEVYGSNCFKFSDDKTHGTVILRDNDGDGAVDR